MLSVVCMHVMFCSVFASASFKRDASCHCTHLQLNCELLRSETSSHIHQDACYQQLLWLPNFCSSEFARCCGSCTFCIQCSAIMSPFQQVSISTGQLFEGVRLRICRSEAHGLFEVHLQRPGGRPLLHLALAVVPATILPPHDCQRRPQ